MTAMSVIELLDATGELLVCKYPFEGPAAITLGSQLVVQENQVAVFFRDGRMLDGFTAGRHTLSAENLPQMGGLIGAAFGDGSPFSSYIYFVATKTFINQGWGTSKPVLFRDADFGMVSLRAHGTYAVRVLKPRTFLNALVGACGMETSHALGEYLRTLIVSRLSESLDHKLKNIRDLPALNREIGEDVKGLVENDLEQYGLTLTDFIIEGITPLPSESAISTSFNKKSLMRMLIPVDRSIWAVAAGYLALLTVSFAILGVMLSLSYSGGHLGIFSVLRFFAPFTLMTGIMALRDIKNNPGKIGNGRAWFGIIAGVSGITHQIFQ